MRQRKLWRVLVRSDKQHRYFFRLYALNTISTLPNEASKEQIQQTIKGKIIAETELIGLYARLGQRTD